MPDDEYQAVLRFWSRHQERRRASCPTVSLWITGTAPSAVAIANALGAAGLTAASSRASAPALMANDWLCTIEDEHDVLDRGAEVVDSIHKLVRRRRRTLLTETAA